MVAKTKVISSHSIQRIGISSDSMHGWQSFWEPSIPPQVLAFRWVARWHKILTLDKLRRRKHIIISGCPKCLKNEETVHHLMIHCIFAHRVCSAILNMLDMHWVIAFQQWHLCIKYVRGNGRQCCMLTFGNFGLKGTTELS